MGGKQSRFHTNYPINHETNSCGTCRCHGLSVYPVCVCNTVRLGQDTTWNRLVHGLSVYPVWVCDKVRLGQDTTWNRREHRLSVSPNWVCTMLGGYKRWTFSDGFGDKPSHSIRCVYRADLILCRYRLGSAVTKVLVCGKCGQSPPLPSPPLPSLPPSLLPCENLQVSAAS